MEEKTIKLAEGIIESCVTAQYLLEYIKDYKDSDKVYLDAVELNVWK